MQVQAINFTNRNYGINPNKNAGNVNTKNVQKSNLDYSPLSFKGNFNQVIKEVAKRDIKDSYDINRAVMDLYSSLLNTEGIVKSQFQPIFDRLLNNGASLPAYNFVRELCKPADDIKPEYRDLVSKLRLGNSSYETIISKNGTDLFYIHDEGKITFIDNLINLLYDNEDEANSFILCFGDGNGHSFKFGPYNYMNRRCKVEQWADDYGTASKFKDGKRISSRSLKFEKFIPISPA